jgi:hypothetical protein
VNHLSADEVMNEARTLYAQWPNVETEAKRKIVESITEKITIGKDNEIEITLSYLPTSEVITKTNRAFPPGSLQRMVRRLGEKLTHVVLASVVYLR